MKRIKYILIVLIGILLISSASIAQVPTLSVKYNAQIYAWPANEVNMTIIVWKTGFPNTIEDAENIEIPALGPGESYLHTCPSIYSGYDIYGVQIEDNSGGGNDGWVGETYGTTDDFNYKPYTTVLHYHVDYSTGGTNSAAILIH